VTNPRVYLEGKPKTFDNVDQAESKKLRDRPVLTEQEISGMLEKAESIENEYFRLRIEAIIGLLKIFGKRRLELSLLEMADINAQSEMLYVTFTVVKKHKRGLHQYIAHLKKLGDLELLNKTLPQLEAEWHNWTLTESGYKLKRTKKPKVTPLKDKYAKLVFAYYSYMKANYPTAKFLFPSGKAFFGNYIVFPEKNLSGRQILNLIKELEPTAWTHLFRKGKGSEVARKYGRTLESVFMVKETLDLERQETALHYIEENVPKLETGET
jgi:integrase